jgi:hypothetical protein
MSITASGTASPGTTLAPLATFADAVNFGSGALNLRDFTDPSAQTDLMWMATSQIEDRCGRRLAPFTGITESTRAEGVDIDVLGSADMPMNLPTALGFSQSIAFASTDLVRDYMLDQYAPVRSDLWEYSITSIDLLLAYGNTFQVVLGQIQGPQPDTGHIRFNLGTFCPVGTTIVTTYGGGYQTTPYSLKLATILQAFKFAVIGAEPEQRKDMSTLELDAEILSLIAPYIRS